jgi:hypothetical protein
MFKKFMTALCGILTRIVVYKLGQVELEGGVKHKSFRSNESLIH